MVRVKKDNKIHSRRAETITTCGKRVGGNTRITSCPSRATCKLCLGKQKRKGG